MKTIPDYAYLFTHPGTLIKSVGDIINFTFLYRHIERTFLGPKARRLQQYTENELGNMLDQIHRLVSPHTNHKFRTQSIIIYDEHKSVERGITKAPEYLRSIGQTQAAATAERLIAKMLSSNTVTADEYAQLQLALVDFGFLATHPAVLKQEYRQFLSNLRAKLQTEPADQVSAWAHVEFTKIHPYADGNGSTARALLNIIRMQDDLNTVVFDNDAEYSIALDEDLKNPGYFYQYVNEVAQKDTLRISTHSPDDYFERLASSLIELKQLTTTHPQPQLLNTINNIINDVEVTDKHLKKILDDFALSSLLPLQNLKMQFKVALHRIENSGSTELLESFQKDMKKISGALENPLPIEIPAKQLNDDFAFQLDHQSEQPHSTRHNKPKLKFYGANKQPLAGGKNQRTAKPTARTTQANLLLAGISAVILIVIFIYIVRKIYGIYCDQTKAKGQRRTRRRKTRKKASRTANYKSLTK